MKMLTMALSAAVLVFSSGTLANSNHQKITAMQQACDLKQVKSLVYVRSTCQIKAISADVWTRKLMVLSVCILSNVKSSQS